MSKEEQFDVGPLLVEVPCIKDVLGETGRVCRWFAHTSAREGYILADAH